MPAGLDRGAPIAYRRAMTRKILLVALAAGLLVPAIPQAAPRKAPQKPVKLDPFPIGQSFRLASINGRPVSGNLTLKVDDSLRGSGSSGCNTWSAAMYPLKDGRLAMGPVAMTRRACPGPAMALERRYLQALHSGLHWSTPPGALVLKGAAGTLRFERAF
jgi:heat shock protein HslJ